MFGSNTSTIGGAPGTTNTGFSTPAPAFGTTAPFGASSTGPSFGTPGFGTAAPGSFGTPSTATSFGVFGSTPTSAPSTFGAPTAGQPQPTAHLPPPKTHYKELPQEWQTAIDQLATIINNHRRTMTQVHCLAPKELNTQVDALTGENYVPLRKEIHGARIQMEAKLMPEVANLLAKVTDFQTELRETIVSTITDAKWPVEFVANSRGVRITKPERKTEETMDAETHALLERQASHVHRVERLPSPFFWKALQMSQKMLVQLQDLQDSIKARTEGEDWTGVPVTYLLDQQGQEIFHLHRDLNRLAFYMQQLRAQYARMETKVPNVIEEADLKEAERQRKIDHEYHRAVHLTKVDTPGQATAAGNSLFCTTTSFGSTFGAGASPAGGIFGGSSSSTSFTGFGSNAPSPGVFSNFTASTGSAPAPSGTNAPFGSQSGGGVGLGTVPAPTTTPFVAPAAAAPVSFGPVGGTSTTSGSSSSTKKPAGRRSGRRR